MDKLKITDKEISENNVKSAADNLRGNPRDVKDVFDRLPELIADRHNELVDNLYSKAQVDERINKKVVEIGAGDMAQAVYDENGDGVADNSENLGGRPAEYYATHDDMKSVAAAAQKAQNAADEAMPKSGGVFSGNVVGASIGGNLSGLRNMSFFSNDGIDITDNVVQIKCYDK